MSAPLTEQPARPIAGTGADRTFISLYVLAYAGLFIAFIPFFTILLPMKVAAVAAPDRVEVLSRITLAGVLVASIANLLFGALSDRTYARRGTRRPWIGAGFVALLLAYLLVYLASEPHGLLAAVLFLQMALNMMFAPLVAVMADEVPDEHKGLVAGLLGSAHPVASVSAVLVTLPWLASEASRYAIVCVLVAAALAPFLTLAREPGTSTNQAAPPPFPVAVARRDLALAWSARLAVQIAGTSVVTYIFFFLDDVISTGEPSPPLPPTQLISWIFACATVCAVVLAILCGRLSDRLGRRKPLLAISLTGMVAGLSTMAAAGSWPVAAAGYGLFTSAYSVNLSLLSAFTMQLLPSPKHHGRDLGFFNLTNTLPAAAGPLLAIGTLSSGDRLDGLWLTIAMLCGFGGLLALFVQSKR